MGSYQRICNMFKGIWGFTSRDFYFGSSHFSALIDVVFVCLFNLATKRWYMLFDPFRIQRRSRAACGGPLPSQPALRRVTWICWNSLIETYLGNASSGNFLLVASRDWGQNCHIAISVRKCFNINPPLLEDIPYAPCMEYVPTFALQITLKCR